jgi:hypothetical protein
MQNIWDANNTVENYSITVQPGLEMNGHQVANGPFPL